MAFAYVLDPCLQHQNRAGVNNVHGYFKVYLAGTDDLAETYSDFGGSLNPENIEIDNNGRCVIIADSSHPYRVEMYLPNGDLVYTQEPVWTLASGGGASIIDIESTDASVQIDKTTVGGKVTYDLSVNEDDPNRLDWIKCLGAQLVDGIYVPQKSAGTLNMGEKGISLEAEMYYHATVRVKATKNQQRLPYYDEVNVVLGLWDGETTTTIGTYKRIVDYSLGLSQEFEVGADVKVGNLNSQLVISIAGQDHQGGDFEIPEVDLHRVYSGVPRLPAGVATRAWVNENFQKKLVPGENITIDPVVAVDVGETIVISVPSSDLAIDTDSMGAQVEDNTLVISSKSAFKRKTLLFENAAAYPNNLYEFLQTYPLSESLNNYDYVMFEYVGNADTNRTGVVEVALFKVSPGPMAVVLHGYHINEIVSPATTWENLAFLKSNSSNTAFSYAEATKFRKIDATSWDMPQNMFTVNKIWGLK